MPRLPCRATRRLSRDELSRDDAAPSCEETYYLRHCHTELASAQEKDRAKIKYLADSRLCIEKAFKNIKSDASNLENILCT